MEFKTDNLPEEKFNETSFPNSVNKCYFCSEIKENLLGLKLKYCSSCLKHQESIFEKIIKAKKKPIPNYDQITENVYLGNFGSALIREELKFIGVGHILCCALAMPIPFPGEFIYNNLNIIDDSDENILPYLIEGIEFIENSKENILVHCQAGVSRSASVVIAYVMWKMRLSFEDALNFVRNKRKCVYPNEGFVLQLKEFQDYLKSRDYNLK